MSSTNIGNQHVVYHFHYPLNAKDINYLFHHIIPPGILEGMELSKITDSSVKISSGVMFIEDRNHELSVGVHTQSDATVDSITFTTRRIIARYEWKEPSNPDDNVERDEAEHWYAEFLNLAPGDELPTDIIIGDVIYTGASITGFDYSYRTQSKINIFKSFLGIYDNHSTLNNLLNAEAGSLVIIRNADTDPNNKFSYPTLYISTGQGSTVQERWKPFNISAGIQVFWAGTTSNIPEDFLLCDGSEVSRTQFSQLFSALSTIHGSGDGSTTFNIPDLINKFIRSENTSGHTGGSDDAVVIDHTHTMQPTGDHTHSATGGSHTHTLYSNGSHYHSVAVVNTSSTTKRGSSSHAAANNVSGSHNTSIQTASRDHTHSLGSTGSTHTHGCSTENSHIHTIDNTGEDGTGKNMPSYYSFIPIIKGF